MLRAPGNGPNIERIAITNFVLEDSIHDYVIMEVNEQEGSALGFSALDIYTGQVEDGTRVLTYGYPSPKITRANVDLVTGRLRGLSVALFTHANEGIVSSQYGMGREYIYELNVGWHHGESGGPILILNPPRVIAIMQRYKNIDTPHGTVAGPHMGMAITAISDDIAGLT